MKSLCKEIPLMLSRTKTEKIGWLLTHWDRSLASACDAEDSTTPYSSSTVAASTNCGKTDSHTCALVLVELFSGITA